MGNNSKTLADYRLLDGDTLVDKTTGERVRLRHGDTPEVTHAGSPYQPGARPAMDALVHLAETQPHTVELTDERGTHGRTLGVVRFADGKTSNEKLIEAGLASQATGFETARSGNARVRRLMNQANGISDAEANPELAEFINSAQSERAAMSRARIMQLINSRRTYYGDGLEHRGAFKGSLHRGTDQMQGMFYGMGMALADLTGADATAADFRENMLRNMVEASKNPAKIASYEDIDSWADAGTFTVEAIGEMASQVAVDILAGLATGGTALAMKEGLAGIGKTLLRKQSLSVDAKEFAKNVGVYTSAISSYAQNTGETVQGFYSEGRYGKDGALAEILTTGAAKTALDFGSLLHGVNKAVRTGRLDDAAKALDDAGVKTYQQFLGVLKESGKNTLTQFGVEGVTEGLQTIADELALRGYDPNLQIDWKEVINATLKGGLAGGSFAGGGSLASGLLNMQTNIKGEIDKANENNPQPVPQDDPGAALQQRIDALNAAATSPRPTEAQPATRGDPSAALQQQVDALNAAATSPRPTEAQPVPQTAPPQSGELNTPANPPIGTPLVGPEAAAQVRPEPVTDLKAQMDGILRNDAERDTMFLPVSTPQGVKQAFADRAAREGLQVSYDDQKGMIISSSPEKVAQFEALPAYDSNAIAAITYNGKAIPLDAATTHVVQALDANGAVAAENATTPERAEQTAQDMAALSGETQVVVKPMEQALAERDQKVQSEQVAEPLPVATKAPEPMVTIPKPTKVVSGRTEAGGAQAQSPQVVGELTQQIAQDANAQSLATLEAALQPEPAAEKTKLGTKAVKRQDEDTPESIRPMVSELTEQRELAINPVSAATDQYMNAGVDPARLQGRTDRAVDMAAMRDTLRTTIIRDPQHIQALAKADNKHQVADTLIERMDDAQVLALSERYNLPVQYQRAIKEGERQTIQSRVATALMPLYSPLPETWAALMDMRTRAEKLIRGLPQKSTPRADKRTDAEVAADVLEAMRHNQWRARIGDLQQQLDIPAGELAPARVGDAHRRSGVSAERRQTIPERLDELVQKREYVQAKQLLDRYAPKDSRRAKFDEVVSKLEHIDFPGPEERAAAIAVVRKLYQHTTMPARTVGEYVAVLSDKELEHVITPRGFADVTDLAPLFGEEFKALKYDGQGALSKFVKGLQAHLRGRYTNKQFAKSVTQFLRDAPDDVLLALARKYASRGLDKLTEDARVAAPASSAVAKGELAARQSEDRTGAVLPSASTPIADSRAEGALPELQEANKEDAARREASERKQTFLRRLNEPALRSMLAAAEKLRLVAQQPNLKGAKMRKAVAAFTKSVEEVASVFRDNIVDVRDAYALSQGLHVFDAGRSKTTNPEAAEKQARRKTRMEERLSILNAATNFLAGQSGSATAALEVLTAVHKYVTHERTVAEKPDLLAGLNEKEREAVMRIAHEAPVLSAFDQMYGLTGEASLLTSTINSALGKSRDKVRDIKKGVPLSLAQTAHAVATSAVLSAPVVSVNGRLYPAAIFSAMRSAHGGEYVAARNEAELLDALKNKIAHVFDQTDDTPMAKHVALSKFLHDQTQFKWLGLTPAQRVEQNREMTAFKTRQFERDDQRANPQIAADRAFFGAVRGAIARIARSFSPAHLPVITAEGLRRPENADAQDYPRLSETHEVLVLDFETRTDRATGLTLDALGQDYKRYVEHDGFEVQLVTVRRPGGKTTVYDAEAFRAEFAPLFERAEGAKPVAVVAHNAAFDAAVMKHHFQLEPDLIVDTQQVAAGILTPYNNGQPDAESRFTSRFSLEAITHHEPTRRLFGIKTEKLDSSVVGRVDGMSYKEIHNDEALYNEFEKYAVADTDAAAELFDSVDGLLHKDELARMHRQALYNLDPLAFDWQSVPVDELHFSNLNYGGVSYRVTQQLLTDNNRTNLLVVPINTNGHQTQVPIDAVALASYSERTAPPSNPVDAMNTLLNSLARLALGTEATFTSRTGREVDEAAQQFRIPDDLVIYQSPVDGRFFTFGEARELAAEQSKAQPDYDKLVDQHEGLANTIRLVELQAQAAIDEAIANHQAKIDSLRPVATPLSQAQIGVVEQRIEALKELRGRMVRTSPERLELAALEQRRFEKYADLIRKAFEKVGTKARVAHNRNKRNGAGPLEREAPVNPALYNTSVALALPLIRARLSVRDKSIAGLLVHLREATDTLVQIKYDIVHKKGDVNTLRQDYIATHEMATQVSAIIKKLKAEPITQGSDFVGLADDFPRSDAEADAVAAEINKLFINEKRRSDEEDAFAALAATPDGVMPAQVTDSPVPPPTARIRTAHHIVIGHVMPLITARLSLRDSAIAKLQERLREARAELAKLQERLRVARAEADLAKLQDGLREARAESPTDQNSQKALHNRIAGIQGLIDKLWAEPIAKGSDFLTVSEDLFQSHEDAEALADNLNRLFMREDTWGGKETVAVAPTSTESPADVRKRIDKYEKDTVALSLKQAQAVLEHRIGKTKSATEKARLQALAQQLPRDVAAMQAAGGRKASGLEASFVTVSRRDIVSHINRAIADVVDPTDSELLDRRIAQLHEQVIMGVDEGPRHSKQDDVRIEAFIRRVFNNDSLGLPVAIKDMYYQLSHLRAVLNGIKNQKEALEDSGEVAKNSDDVVSAINVEIRSWYESGSIDWDNLSEDGGYQDTEAPTEAVYDENGTPVLAGKNERGEAVQQSLLSQDDGVTDQAAHAQYEAEQAELANAHIGRSKRRVTGAEGMSSTVVYPDQPDARGIAQVTKTYADTPIAHKARLRRRAGSRVHANFTGFVAAERTMAMGFVDLLNTLNIEQPVFIDFKRGTGRGAYHDLGLQVDGSRRVEITMPAVFAVIGKGLSEQEAAVRAEWGRMAWLSSLAHEVGHVVRDLVWDNMSAADQQVLRNAFDVAADASIYHVDNTSEAAFTEWYADQLRKVVLSEGVGTGTNRLGHRAKTLLLRAARTIGEYWAKVVMRLEHLFSGHTDPDMVRVQKAVLDHFNALANGKIALRNARAQDNATYNDSTNPVQLRARANLAARTGKGAINVFRSVMNRVHSYSPDLARMLFQKSQAAGVKGRSYEQLHVGLVDTFRGMAERAFTDLGGQHKAEAALRELYAGKDTAAARRMRKLIDDIHDRAKREGFRSVELTAAHVPVAFNPKAAPLAQAELERLAPLVGVEAAEVQKIFDKAYQDVELDDDVHIGPSLPVSLHKNTRRLIDKLGVAKLIELGVIIDNPMATLEHYISGLGKRTAFDHVFGAERVNPKSVDVLDPFATPRTGFRADAKLQLLLDDIGEAHGEAAKQEVTDLLLGAFGRNNHTAPVWWRKIQEYAIGVTNLVLLGFSGIASLPELAGGVIRAGGNIRDVIAGLGDKESRRVAKDSGIIIGHAFNQVIRESLGEGYESTILRKLNEGFFKLNGQELITRLSRTIASATAYAFITRMASEHNATELAKLHISPAQVQRWLASGASLAPETLSGETRADAEAMLLAFSQFTNEASLNPSKFQSPAFGNNPYLKIIYHMKHFLYTYGSTIIGGVWRNVQQRYADAARAGSGKTDAAIYSMAPVLIAVAATLPLAMLSLTARDWRNGTNRATTLEGSALFADLFTRAGGLGPVEIAANVARHIQWAAQRDESLAALGAAPIAALVPAVSAGMLYLDPDKSLDNKLRVLLPPPLAALSQGWKAVNE